MAKFVVSGKAGCPFYARAELIAEELKNRLPHFSIHKMVISDRDWDAFIESKLDENKWNHTGKSPLIWRELVKRGGKGLLVGGCDDFLELATEYYGLTCNKTSLHLLDIASENEAQRKEEIAEKEEASRLIIPFKITITNASSMVAYSLILDLLNQFPIQGPISLTLLDKDGNDVLVDGLAMEIVDCAFPNVLDIKNVSKPELAFIDSDLVIILDNDNTNKSIDDTMIYENDEILLLKSYANFIQTHAKNDSLIIIATESPGVACSVMCKAAPQILPQNIYGIIKHHENTAKSCIAKKLKIKTSNVKDVFIWGKPCIANEQSYDFTNTRVVGCDSAVWGPHIKEFSLPINEVIRDEKWVQKELQNEIKERYTSYNGNNSLRIGSAISSQIRDLLNGQTDPTELFSVVVCMEPYFNQFKNIFVSVPVIISSGRNIKIMELSPEKEETLKKLCENAQETLEKVLNLANS